MQTSPPKRITSLKKYSSIHADPGKAEGMVKYKAIPFDRKMQGDWNYPNENDYCKLCGGLPLNFKQGEVRSRRQRRFDELNAKLGWARLLGMTHKTWQTVGGATVRLSHMDANTQRVPIDSKFRVGGEELFLPSDPNASFAETANCRCDVSFSAKTDVDRLSPVAVNPLNLSRIAYGEFRSHAWRRDRQVPRGLADAVLSAGMACLRGNPCSPVDGSAATENDDKIAWETIRNAASGTDRSGGGDLMCVGNQMCRYVDSAFTWVGRQKTLVPRDEPLQTTGRVTISNAQRGSLTLYFYKLPFRGWLRREDLLGPPAGG